eukprot:SAG31_NODE_2661_length_5280_cov_2.196101_1_plen_251_part_00
MLNSDVKQFVFPKKTTARAVLSKNSDSTILKRQQELGDFMKQVVQYGELRDDNEFRKFINAPFIQRPVTAPKSATSTQPPAAAAAGSMAKIEAPLASGGPAIVQVVIDDGSAGFAAADGTLTVKTVASGQACEKAGVLKGMVVAKFQGEMLPVDFTWTQLKEKVKAAPKPWKFVFVGTVAVVVPAGLLINHARSDNHRPSCAHSACLIGLGIVTQAALELALQLTTTLLSRRSTKMVQRKLQGFSLECEL